MRLLSAISITGSLFDSVWKYGTMASDEQRGLLWKILEHTALYVWGIWLLRNNIIFREHTARIEQTILNVKALAWMAAAADTRAAEAFGKTWQAALTVHIRAGTTLLVDRWQCSNRAVIITV
ncbi:hypothetical protein FRX31_002165, partial [Thalictrum thalictroides]